MWTCGVDAWKKSTRLPSLRHSRPEGGGFAAGSSPADAPDRNARAVVQRIRISEKRSRREGGGRTRSETGSVYGTKTRAFPLRRHRPTARGPPSVCRRTCRQTRTQSFAKIRRRTKGPATVRLTNGFIRTASEAPLPLRRSKPEVSAASAGQAAFRHEKYRNRNSFAVRLRPDRQGLRAMGRPQLQGCGEPPASPWQCRINFKKTIAPRSAVAPPPVPAIIGHGPSRTPFVETVRARTIQGDRPAAILETDTATHTAPGWEENAESRGDEDERRKTASAPLYSIP